jgi:hypothetical protein
MDFNEVQVSNMRFINYLDNEKMKKQQELDALDVQRILKLVLDRLSNLVKTRFKYQEISSLHPPKFPSLRLSARKTKVLNYLFFSIFFLFSPQVKPYHGRWPKPIDTL